MTNVTDRTPTLLVNILLGGCWEGHPDRDELVQLFRECLGVSLMGLAPVLQRPFLLYGSGSNGKSQVMDVVSGLFPLYERCSIAPNQLEEALHVARLLGKKLNVQRGLTESSFSCARGFKVAVTGSVLTGWLPYQGSFNFKPQTSFWFENSCLPPIKDISRAFFRRWVLFPFQRQIPKSEQIKDLGKRIVAEERDEAIAWAVQSVPDALRRGDYIIPSSCTELVRQWQEISQTKILERN